jgi:hypothetical protein
VNGAIGNKKLNGVFNLFAVSLFGLGDVQLDFDAFRLTAVNAFVGKLRGERVAACGDSDGFAHCGFPYT